MAGGDPGGGDLAGCSGAGISCPGEGRRRTWPETGTAGGKISSEPARSVCGPGMEAQTFRFRAGYSQLSLFQSITWLGRKGEVVLVEKLLQARAQFDHEVGNYWVCREGLGVKAAFLPSWWPFPSSRTMNIHPQAVLHKVGRDLGRSSDPTPLLNQGHPEPVAQFHVQMVFEHL